MRIIVDIFGGDNSPCELLSGAIEASRECCADFTLVGNRDDILKIANNNGFDLSRFEIADAPTYVTMEDDPIEVLQTKKDSSMIVGLHLLSDGDGDAFVSCGNTGALFSGATLIVKRLSGIKRAAIGIVLPSKEPCLLIDSGANISVTPEYLEQFAVMGAAYMRKMYGMADPKVGLLNNGTEASKGTPLYVEANRRLSTCEYIRYVGNVEANTVSFGSCNVLVCDGFVGNIFLKTVEGMGKLLLGSIKDILGKNLLTKFSALFLKRYFSEMKRNFDPSEHGGAPILGLAKPVIKAHGSSDAKAFKNAILAAVRYTESGVIDDIREAAQQCGKA